MPPTNILLIGAGELGTAVLHSLIHHPTRTNNKPSLSLLLRPSSIASPKQPPLAALLQSPTAPNNPPISLVPGDIAADSPETLTALFRPYDLIISCAGFVAGPGTQLKITRAVLAAGVPFYIPWQFGVDYDAIGRGSAHDLFDEQLDVRGLLRAQETTRWTVVSTGMFTSFLFAAGFGVVDLPAPRGESARVRALGGWENRVTVTAPADIGRLTAEIVLGDDGLLGANGPVFVGGDTLSYAQVADLVVKATGREVERSVLTVPQVLERLEREPDNALLKYYAVFGAGKGVAWDLEETWNFRKGIHAMTAEEWARENL
ncbi:hypothetical protein RJZ56_005813 [Blastomyces dermatitidis]|nr:hypothetical protein BDFG_01766 [Blastomyces dermatitidis ATCC 26199]